MNNEEAIAKGLDQAYQRVKESKDSLADFEMKAARLIIFSDHHRGVRDGADDFLRCESTYNAALGYYLETGYTLVILGDAEELWECRPKPVIKQYNYTLSMEAQFHKNGRYLKIFGNHDDYWDKPSVVQKLLEPIYGAPLKVREGMCLTFKDATEKVGGLLLLHGHQGDFFSDKDSWFAGISKFAVRYIWRPFQRLTGYKSTTPANDFQLRDKHNIAMYKWAKKKNLVVVAGHTHLPVFASEDHLGIINKELAALKSQLETMPKNGPEVTQTVEKIAQKRAELEYMKTKSSNMSQEEAGIVMDKPCYFNTGCCSYSDGDITGIEITDGEIRLVRWPDDAGNPHSKILASMNLLEVFNKQ